jgi:hypothetical protein
LSVNPDDGAVIRAGQSACDYCGQPLAPGHDCTSLWPVMRWVSLGVSLFAIGLLAVFVGLVSPFWAGTIVVLTILGVALIVLASM